MAKNIQNENYKKRNSKQHSKSNLQYNEYKSNEKSNSRSSENNLRYGNQTSGQNDFNRGSTSTESNHTTEDNKATTLNKKNENNARRNNGYIETKVKNNFTIRGYRRKLESRRKRNDSLNRIDLSLPSNRSCNRIEIKNDRYHTKQSSPWTTSSSNSDPYLEAGTYEGDLLVKDDNSREKFFSDDDTYSVLSDITDFCQREQYNVDCYNYYLNFGDPYVMNNGEISSDDRNWYYDRQPNYGRVFYYRSQSQFNDLCYESAMRYNYPNHQEFKYRNIESYTYCNPRGVCMNNYMTNSYINGYVESGLLPNDYYPYQIAHPQEFMPDRFFKPVIYEEPDDIYSTNHYTPENDTLNVINLNSSLVVYNSNVQINTVRSEVHGVNTTANTETGDFLAGDEVSINTNDIVVVGSSMNTTDKIQCDNTTLPSVEYENCN